MASSLGKVPITSERRLISSFTRSSRFVLAICGQCSRGKYMQASTSSRDPSTRAPSFGCFPRSASATASRCASASALLSCAKMVFSLAATAARCLVDAWASALRIQSTRHRWWFAIGVERMATRWLTAEHPKRGGPQPLVDKPHFAQAAIGETAEELGPEHLGIGFARMHAQHLALVRCQMI